MSEGGRSTPRQGAPRPDARTAAKERRRQRILEAAERLFAGPGYAKTSVDEIARAARVSKGLIYAHYASKDDLLAEVWWRLVDGWVEATRREAKLSEDAVAESVAEVLRASVGHARAHPHLRRIAAQDPGALLPDQREPARAFARHYREQLEAALRHGVRAGQLRPDLDVPHTAELVWMIHFTLIRELFVEGRWREDADALLSSAVSFVVAGLRGS